MSPIKRAKILHKFDNLREKLYNVDYINCGGCAIAAYVMYMWLKKRKIKSEIIYLYSDASDSYDKNTKYIKNKVEHATSCSHAGIRLDEKIIDVEKKIYMGYYECHHKVSVKLVIDSLKYSTTWNEIFEREISIPIIEDLSGIKVPI